MTEEPSLINLAGSSSKPLALLALILFNILEICSIFVYDKKYLT